jgi:secreted PhoX family phosphatase
MGEIIGKRFSRRNFLQGSLAVSAIATTVGPLALMSADAARAQEKSGSAFKFTEVEAGVDAKHHVAQGYDADILLRWGDAVLPGAPEFDPTKQTADGQSKQFSYNNDYVGYIPLEGSAEHGLLVVNHEYTNPHLMFPGLVKVVDGKIKQGALSKKQVDVEMAAHGGTIVEIRKQSGKWQVVTDGKYNRRVTANTPMEITGPAAGDDRPKTNVDATGTRAIGTINNCAGGVTPWGTYIMAEENFHGYFSGKLPEGHKEATNYKRYGVPEGGYEWGNFYDRFDLSKEPNEPNRFGWIVEVDVMTQPPRRESAPRSAAPSMRGPNLSSPRTARSSSISVTTNGSTMSTSS